MGALANLKSGLQDVKSRTLFLFMFIILAILFIIFFIFYKKSSDNIARDNQRTTLSNPASQVRSIPGTGPSSKQYLDLEQQHTQKVVDKALKTGGSAVSPIFPPGESDAFKKLSALANNQSLGGGQGGNSETGSGGLINNPNNSLSNSIENYKKLRAEKMKQLQDQLAANRKAQDEQMKKLQQQQQAQLDKQLHRQQQQQYEQNLQAAVQKLKTMPGWSETMTPIQQEVKAEVVPKTPQQKAIEMKAELLKSMPRPNVLLKAGEILYGSLVNNLNSDSTSINAPVLVDISMGPLKGAKVLGTIDPTSIPTSSLSTKVSTALVLKFNQINLPGISKSLKISAVGIDPNNTDSGFATDVDHHYLLRYGTFLSAAFLSGLSQILQNEGTSSSISMGNLPNSNQGGGSLISINRSSPMRSGRQKIEIALGTAMQQLISQMNYLSIPPTIKVAAGSSVGVLLLSDLTDNELQPHLPNLMGHSHAHDSTKISGAVDKVSHEDKADSQSHASRVASLSDKVAAHDNTNTDSNENNYSPTHILTQFLNRQPTSLY